MASEFKPLQVAVLTVSDTRTDETDTSGDLLLALAREAGHKTLTKSIIPDDIYKIRAAVSIWIAAPEVQVILITGGTGFSGRDSTPEAVVPLLDKEVVGFGELYRQLSYREVGSSTVQSRATAGLANRTMIFCLPGSNNACKTAWEGILSDQLDNRHKPCNFATYLHPAGTSG